MSRNYRGHRKFGNRPPALTIVKPDKQVVIDLINRRVRRSLIASGAIPNPAERQPRFDGSRVNQI
jgi:hypothetical protein